MAVQVETVLLIKHQNRPTLLIPQQPKIEGNYLAGILSAVGEIRELPGISTSKGILKTILNNTVARWTYGGSFSGVIEGNASNTLNSGIVDTLEGTGYTGRRVYGNGETTVNNGQVDWFLSGGGWNDLLIGGNVAVTVL